MPKKEKSLPYELPPFTSRIIPQGHRDHTMSFLDKVLAACQRRFNAYYEGIKGDLNPSEGKILEQHRQQMFIEFYVGVKQIIYQQTALASEDLPDDGARGAKQIEIERRMDLERLVNEVSPVLPPEVAEIFKRKLKRAERLTGRQISGERVAVYSGMDKMEAEEIERRGHRPPRVWVAEQYIKLHRKELERADISCDVNNLSEAWAKMKKKSRLGQE